MISVASTLTQPCVPLILVCTLRFYLAAGRGLIAAATEDAEHIRALCVSVVDRCRVLHVSVEPGNHLIKSVLDRFAGLVTVGFQR
jgi:hypothetical protein